MTADYVNAGLGGGMIALSVIIMLLFLGRIAGISGILWTAVSGRPFILFKILSWRWFFLAGLPVGSFLANKLFGVAQPAPSEAGPIMALLAGLLVGFGTKLGSGCTSGHGICGISRFSRRSIVATTLFMFSGMTTVYVAQHLL